MELQRQTDWLLSPVELHLCVSLLGRQDWVGPSCWISERELERRMLDGFLHLIDLGLLERTGEAWQGTELLRERLMAVAWPKRILVLKDGDTARYLYRDREITAVEMRFSGQQEACRIYPVLPEEISLSREEARGEWTLLDGAGRPLRFGRVEDLPWKALLNGFLRGEETI